MLDRMFEAVAGANGPVDAAGFHAAFEPTIGTTDLLAQVLVKISIFLAVQVPNLFTVLRPRM
jgi:hypothetical protein